VNVTREQFQEMEERLAKGRAKKHIFIVADAPLHDAAHMLKEYHENHHNPQRLRASIEQPSQRPTLEPSPEREESRQRCPERRHLHRYRITYTVYAVRPMDFDNIAIKKIQDELVHQNFLPEDNWKVLEGTVRSRKAKTKAEQRTVIEIETLTEPK